MHFINAISKIMSNYTDVLYLLHTKKVNCTSRL